MTYSINYFSIPHTQIHIVNLSRGSVVHVLWKSAIHMQLRVVTTWKMVSQAGLLSPPLMAATEADGLVKDVSWLFVGPATDVTDVTRVVMPDAAATLTARVVGRKGGADICNWPLDMKSRIGCGPYCDMSAPALLFPVIWTCCAEHGITQGSMLGGGHSRGCWCRWPITLSVHM